MKYHIGIDGGGTKTDFLLCDVNGREVFRHQTGPCRFTDGTALLQEDVFAGGLKALCAGAGIDISGIGSACFGMPGYGEFPTEDASAAMQACSCFTGAGIACKVVNDVEVGWAGALALNPGINVVSGTGSISFGRDGKGNTARCGGWWINEGSGYWLGYKAVELFLKQLDRRLERGALYDVMLKELSFEKGSDIFAYTTKHLRNNRQNTASIQLILDKAAQAGDIAALKAYEEAGCELALLVKGCRNQLDFEGRIKVSYTGSIFKAGRKLLDSFLNELGHPQFDIVPPMLDPAQGAVLLGIEAACPGNLENVRAGMLDKCGS